MTTLRPLPHPRPPKTYSTTATPMKKPGIPPLKPPRLKKPK